MSIFRDKTKLYPFQAAIVAHNWKKKGHQVIIDGKGDDTIVYGTRKKGDKQATWKYVLDDYELLHDFKGRELFDLTSEPKGEKIKPIVEAANATLGNTPGAGSIYFPGQPGTQNDFVDQEAGSGDIPAGPNDDEEDEDEEEHNYKDKVAHQIYSQVPNKPISVFKSFENFHQIDEMVKKDKLPIKVKIEKFWNGTWDIIVPAGQMTWDTYDDITTRDNRFTFHTYDYSTGEARLGSFKSEKIAKELVKKFSKYIKESGDSIANEWESLFTDLTIESYQGQILESVSDNIISSETIEENEFYVLKKEMHDMTEFAGKDEPPMEMTSAYSAIDGSYIGDQKMAKFLEKKGIKAEAFEDNNVASIGFSESDGKWYGWSHRAIFGFEEGMSVKKGDIAFVETFGKDKYTINNKEEAKQAAINFAKGVS